MDWLINWLWLTTCLPSCLPDQLADWPIGLITHILRVYVTTIDLDYMDCWHCSPRNILRHSGASVVRFYHCPGASASIWTLVQSKLLVQYNGLR